MDNMIDNILEDIEDKNIFREYINNRLLVDTISFVDPYNKSYLIEELDKYVNEIAHECEYESPTEQLRIILIGKLVIYTCIMYEKIYMSLPQLEFNFISQDTEEFDKKEENEDKYYKLLSTATSTSTLTTNQKSLSSSTTYKIFQTRNLHEIDKYINWLCKGLQLTNEEIICCAILVRRLSCLHNDGLLDWLKDKYDIIMVVILILVRKIYDKEMPLANKFYSKTLKINIHEINLTEIALLMSMKIFINEKEYQSYLHDDWIKFISN